MDNKISTKAKAELIGVLGQRYRESSKMAKTQILEELHARKLSISCLFFPNLLMPYFILIINTRAIISSI